MLKKQTKTELKEGEEGISGVEMELCEETAMEVNLGEKPIVHPSVCHR